MLHSAEVIETVAATIEEEAAGVKLVVDPVMVAKGGARLIDEDAIAALKERLLPLARLITPNLPEAQALTGVDPSAEDGLKAALAAFARMGCRDILFKGGHAEGPVVEDVLGNAQTGALLRLSAPRQDTRHTHGTGCTLATAIACGLAENLSLVEAVGRAHRYVQRAIAAAPGLGQGHGPLGHKV
jgi:hydroxymethylpyrimidine/phosphomethylpyrimidine kinase